MVGTVQAGIGVVMLCAAVVVGAEKKGGRDGAARTAVNPVVKNDVSAAIDANNAVMKSFLSGDGRRAPPVLICTFGVLGQEWTSGNVYPRTVDQL